jgi:hypothetical protein
MGDLDLTENGSETADALRARLSPLVERFVRVALVLEPPDRRNAPQGMLRAVRRFEQWPGSKQSFVTALTVELARHVARRHGGSHACAETRDCDSTHQY